MFLVYMQMLKWACKRVRERGGGVIGLIKLLQVGVGLGELKSGLFDLKGSGLYELIESGLYELNEGEILFLQVSDGSVFEVCNVLK